MISKPIWSLSRLAVRSRIPLPATLPVRASPSLRSSPQASSLILSAQRHFSVGSISRSSGETDSQLVNKLEAEIGYEKDAGSTDPPQWLKEFQADGTFKITDKPGSDEIVLTRTFGNENIRITFSCSDSETNEMDDEGLEVEEEEDDKDAIGSCRIRTAISIIKPGKGGMVIDSSTDGSTFDVDNVSFYDDEKLALDESYESDWKRRGLYFGPTFIDLDEELQQSFTDYLNERAIGSELAAIILDLADHKEQKEYVNWLGKMSKFIKA
ncbi:Mitochondrial acidic protein mam33 [Puccinia graminis f. sp. tritici]|uniref:Mitochondrial acidic protein mam33 n=2 Tax=Puccinia graminis f. sp. tritici TaxID=56615 RepID=E3KUK2_PUCGT|nr:uncharacterized protein PGTG_13756 [Puccinia graminis f. sp. tritici CRL 75-36-700-3]EFP87952.1 hypothetical protein PGTG_13756 [Puccinia graminis f. sp. tritici CRL 75-36-700-3]KAA1083214.1 Mitochondrial acidic protein mam33 [Puccinia graminis f. sp. tritici]KAA1094294.1 Mitochondrial acidic protein mam33 [Puccinia graminis f. sp. tritici]